MHGRNETNETKSPFIIYYGHIITQALTPLDLHIPYEKVPWYTMLHYTMVQLYHGIFVPW